ncbi:hypothetical protein [Stutzerimonas azotifigens]|uniref:hypothetical protein n=1 Tax=Stutzerimonas azotifigens TaxID=291995 RepID=UPI0003FFA6F4|nr:hypothetical protein [Stutzerimonas azotifigens]
MDLQDFDDTALYFDEPRLPRVAALLADAAAQYADGKAERPLLAAHALAPGDLSVLVGLYRFYFYQHRHADALAIAARVLDVVAPRLGLPADWRELDAGSLVHVAPDAIGLLRFHLLALKGAGYLSLRLGLFGQGKSMLAKVVELDADNRLGARLLLDVLAANDATVLTFPPAATLETRP